MEPASCHASLGMLGTASPYVGYRRQRSDEIVRKRGRAPTPICPCRTADASTRIWPSFSSRISLISRPAFTRFPPIMTDRFDTPSPLAAFFRGSPRNPSAPREPRAQRSPSRRDAREAAPLLFAEFPFPVGRLDDGRFGESI